MTKWQIIKIILGALAPLLGLNLLMLAGATAQTLGVLTFFFFDGLVPYRWWLIVGGTAVILVGIVGTKIYARKMQDKSEE